MSGTGETIGVTVAKTSIGSLSSSVSHDVERVVVSSVVRTNIAGTGGSVVTVIGQYVGYWDYSVKVRIGGSGAEATTGWGSDSSIMSKGGRGRSSSSMSGTGETIGVTVAKTSIGSLSSSVSHDVERVVVSSVVRTNIAGTGGSVVTVIGQYVGYWDYSVKVRIGGSGAEATTGWGSDSSIMSKGGRGRSSSSMSGTGETIGVTVAKTSIGSLSSSVSHDVERVVVSSVVRTNIAGTGGSVVTVIGQYVGYWDYSVKVRIGGSGAEATTGWGSDSSIMSKGGRGRSSMSGTGETIGVTVAKTSIGSLSSSVSHDVERVVVSSVVRTNIAGTGGSVVTVIGQYVGYWDYSVKVRIGGSGAEATTGWGSDSSIMSKGGRGRSSMSGTGETIGVTVAKTSIGSLSSSVSHDVERVVVSSVVRTNIAGTGGSVVTVIGQYVGYWDYSVKVRIGGSGAEATTGWGSDSSIMSKGGRGRSSMSGTGETIGVTVAKTSIGSLSSSVSHDVERVVVSSVVRTNIAGTGGSVVTVIGQYVGYWDYSVKVRIGGSGAEATTGWGSDSSIMSKGGRGRSSSSMSGTGETIGVTVAKTSIGSLSSSVSHDVERVVVSSVVRTNIAGTGGSVVTVIGQYVGYWDYSVKVRIGGSGAEATTGWGSDSSIMSKGGRGRSSSSMSGTGETIGVTVAKTSIGSLSSSVSHDVERVVVSSVVRTNIAGTGGSVVTVIGQYVGYWDYSVKVRIGGSGAEATTGWGSDSSIMSKGGRGRSSMSGTGETIGVTVAKTSIGSLSSSVSHDVERVVVSSVVRTNIAGTGGSVVTVIGQYVGYWDYSVKVRIGGSGAEATTGWGSDSSIMSKGGRGRSSMSGTGETIGVTVAKTSIGSLSSSVSHDVERVVVSSVVRTNIAGTGGSVVTVIGQYVGYWDYSVKVRIGGSGAEATTGWGSDSSIMSKGGRGRSSSSMSGTGETIGVTVAKTSIGSLSSSVSHDVERVVVSSVVRTNIAGTGGSVVTVIGQYVGYWDYSVKVRIGGSGAEATTGWGSDSSIMSKGGRGRSSMSGTGETIGVTVAKTSIGSLSSSVSHDVERVVVSSVVRTNIAGTGGSVVTVIGQYVGYWDYSVKVRIGGSGAEATTGWGSDSSIMSKGGRGRS